jgi:hypothetical protein
VAEVVEVEEVPVEISAEPTDLPGDAVVSGEIEEELIPEV